jgi:hypothetical protein
MHYESFLAEVRSDKQLVPLKVQTRELQTVQFVTNGKGSHLLLAVARTYVHLYQIYHRTVRPGDAKITAQPALRQIVARSPLWFAWDVRNSMLAFVVAQPKATCAQEGAQRLLRPPARLLHRARAQRLLSARPRLSGR